MEEIETIIAGTGHRPQKLGNEWEGKGPISEFIIEQVQKIIDEKKPARIISGMALGFDTILAELAIKNNIPLTAAIPFEGQESRWNEKAKKKYFEILNNPLTTKKYVCEPGYAPYKMQKRNQWMVDECTVLIAVWDGTEGGTGNCVKYATSEASWNRYPERKSDLEIIKINPKTKEIGKL